MLITTRILPTNKGDGGTPDKEHKYSKQVEIEGALEGLVTSENCLSVIKVKNTSKK